MVGSRRMKWIDMLTGVLHDEFQSVDRPSMYGGNLRRVESPSRSSRLVRLGRFEADEK